MMVCFRVFIKILLSASPFVLALTLLDIVICRVVFYSIIMVSISIFRCRILIASLVELYLPEEITPLMKLSKCLPNNIYFFSPMILLFSTKIPITWYIYEITHNGWQYENVGLPKVFGIETLIFQFATLFI